MIDVWMAMDPETFRVFIQNREFQDGDFPRGLRGLNWEQRRGQMDESTYLAMLSGELGGTEVDKIHRDLWSESGDTVWPGYA